MLNQSVSAAKSIVPEIGVAGAPGVTTAVVASDPAKAKLDKQSDEPLPTMLEVPSRRSSAYRAHSGCTEEYCLIITRPKFQVSH